MQIDIEKDAHEIRRLLRYARYTPSPKLQARMAKIMHIISKQNRREQVKQAVPASSDIIDMAVFDRTARAEIAFVARCIGNDDLEFVRDLMVDVLRGDAEARQKLEAVFQVQLTSIDQVFVLSRIILRLISDPVRKQNALVERIASSNLPISSVQKGNLNQYVQMRVDCGMTQKELAKCTGWSVKMIHDLENDLIDFGDLPAETCVSYFMGIMYKSRFQSK